MQEYIAYEGKSFIIEWYFNNKGKSQALEYYAQLTQEERIGVLSLFKRMGDSGEIKNREKFNYEGNKIYAFKSHPERFLCFFFRDKKIIVTNSFRKKKQKIPKAEIEMALKYKHDYESRIKVGQYYE